MSDNKCKNCANNVLPSNCPACMECNNGHNYKPDYAKSQQEIAGLQESARYWQDRAGQFSEEVTQLRREVAMLCNELDKYRGQLNQYGKCTAGDALSNTQATAQAYEATVKAKALE